jgi:putative endonuclease
LRWIVYIIECADRTLYTGITNDLAARLEKHANGTGARYTRGRAPYDVIYTEVYETRSLALKREAGIKRMSKLEKIGLGRMKE